MSNFEYFHKFTQTRNLDNRVLLAGYSLASADKTPLEKEIVPAPEFVSLLSVFVYFASFGPVKIEVK